MVANRRSCDHDFPGVGYDPSPGDSPAGPAMPGVVGDEETMELNTSFSLSSSLSPADAHKIGSFFVKGNPSTFPPVLSPPIFSNFVVAAKLAYQSLHNKVEGVVGSLRDHEAVLLHHETVLREASGREADLTAGVHAAFEHVHECVGTLHTQLRGVGGHISTSVSAGLDELREDLQSQFAILEENMAEDQESLWAATDEIRLESHGRVDTLIKSLDSGVPLFVDASVQRALDVQAFVSTST
jgi:hypothetical protein